jgi:hypothetical protein
MPVEYDRLAHFYKLAERFVMNLKQFIATV